MWKLLRHAKPIKGFRDVQKKFQKCLTKDWHQNPLIFCALWATVETNKTQLKESWIDTLENKSLVSKQL